MGREKMKIKLKKKTRPPYGSMFMAIPIIAGAVWSLLNPEKLEKVVEAFEKIEISATTSASANSEAQSPKKNTPANEPNKENSAASKAEDKNAHAENNKETVPQDLSYLSKLNERSQALDQREKELNELEEELQRQKAEVDRRVSELEVIRRQIASTLKEQVEVDEQRVAKLVELYSNMKPKQAADVIANLTDDLAISVLAGMKKKNAAAIMDLLPSDRARLLSEKLTGYKRR